MNKKVLYGVPVAVVIVLTAYNLGGKSFVASVTPEQAVAGAQTGEATQTVKLDYSAELVTKRLRSEKGFWSTFEHSDFSSEFFGLSMYPGSENETGWLITLNSKPLAEIAFDVTARGENASTVTAKVTVTAASLPDSDNNLTANKAAAIEKLITILLPKGLKAIVDGKPADFAALEGKFSLTENQILTNIRNNLGLSEDGEDFAEDDSDDFTSPAINPQPFDAEDDGEGEDAQDEAPAQAMSDEEAQENLGFDPNQVEANAKAEVAETAAAVASEDPQGN